MSSMPEDSDSPYGRVVALLSQRGKLERVRSGGYLAHCPAHADGTASLKVDRGGDGRVLFDCKAGCTFKDIVAAMGLKERDLFADNDNAGAVTEVRSKQKGPAVTLAEFAEHKKLPVEFLKELGWRDGRNGIEIPYKTRDGRLHVTRMRRGRNIKDGVWWSPSGAELVAYEPDGGALARQERYLLLVEGESDTATLLLAGFPACGAPGADTVANVVQAHHLDGIERVFYVREPDRGGDKFSELAPKRLDALGFKGGVHELRMPDAAKDASALWQRDPPAFATKLNEAMAAAQKRDARELVEWRTTEQIFETLPPVRWAIRGLKMPPGRPSIWAGYGASAKTLSMQSLLLACASGTPAFGYFETEQMKVLHFDYEQGWYATARRYQRLAIGHGIRKEALENRLQVTVFPKVRLDDPNAVDAFSKLCDGAGLAVIDALRGSMPTQDENDSRIREHIDKLTHISERTGCAFVLLHHAAKPQESHKDKRTVLRGSAAIFDAAGPVFVACAGRAKGDPRLVSQEKMAAEAEGLPVEEFHLAVEDVPRDGNPTAGVRVLHRAITAPDEIAENSAELDKRASKILDAVRRYPGESKNKVIARAGITKSTGLDIIRDLERAKRVRVEPGATGERVFIAPANNQHRPGGGAE